MRVLSLWIAFSVSVIVIIAVFYFSSNSQGRSTSPYNIHHISIRETRTRRQAVEPYYDFLINEWSFKFWAVFQLVTIAVLLYSTFAAIYYAKWTYLRTQPTEEDIFFRKRSLDAGITRWGEG